MRTLLLFLIIVLCACNKPKPEGHVCTMEQLALQVIHTADSAYARDSILIMDQMVLINNQHTVIKIQEDSINKLLQLDCSKLEARHIQDSLALKAQNFRVNRIKFYLKICNKNPKQDKFLKGWINRAVQ